MDASDDLVPGRVRCSPRVLIQHLDDEAVLLDLRTDSYFSLNEVAARFWQLLADDEDLDACLARLTAEYEIDEATLRSDIEALVEELLAAGLLVHDGT